MGAVTQDDARQLYNAARASGGNQAIVFASDLLGSSVVAAPQQPEQLAALFAWMACEGPDPRANNPFNTSLQEPPELMWDRQNTRIPGYTTPSTGLGATVQTLRGGWDKYGYKNIVFALRAAPFSMPAFASALRASPWCAAPCPAYRNLESLYNGYIGSLDGFTRAANRVVVGGDLGSAHGGAVPGSPIPIPNPLPSILGWAEALGKALSWLIDPHNWQRIGLVASGALLIVVGLSLVAKQLGAPSLPALASKVASTAVAAA